MGQEGDLQGKWVGWLSQTDKSWKYTMTMDIEQTGGDISGVVRYDAIDQAYVIYNFKGMATPSGVEIEETTAVGYSSGKGDMGVWYWCLKLLKGEWRRGPEGLTLDGSWKNNGNKGFSEGRYYDNLQACPPGIFHVVKKLGCAELIRNYIGSNLKAWAQKGKNEKAEDWRLRVSPAQMAVKKQQLLNEYSKALMKETGFKLEYEANKDRYMVRSECFAPFPLPVPAGESECFVNGFQQAVITQTVCSWNEGDRFITVDSFAIASLCNNKSYSYQAAPEGRNAASVSDALAGASSGNTKVPVSAQAQASTKPVSAPDPLPDLRLHLRKFIVLDSVRLDTAAFTVSLYDNGAIDGDIVSVFFNGRLVADKKMLTDKPIVLSLTMEAGRKNLLVMHAENVGSIPPNTALMVIGNGHEKKEIRMSSDMTTSGTVEFFLNKN